jgi:formylglycine-generating enzyme
MVELLAEGVWPSVPQQTVEVGKGVEMTFSWIPPGTFLMGSPPDEEAREDNETQHRVVLTKGYYLGICQVTQAQWQAVMDSNRSFFEGEDRPVELVSWYDCQEFCKRLGTKTDKRYRLPTEAEWEYSCRAGTTTPFHFGRTISTDQANYNGEEGKEGKDRGETLPVGSFPANAWGPFDLHGNVLEWCSDWFGPYSKEDIKDPESVSDISACVLRGGSWYGLPDLCRSASRRRNAPSDRDYAFGCRVVLCLD